MAMTRAALEEERRGYERRGLKDRVALVDEQIKLLGDEPEPTIEDQQPDNGGVDPRDLKPVGVEPTVSFENGEDGEVESTDEQPEVETATEPKPRKRTSRSSTAKPKG